MAPAGNPTRPQAPLLTSRRNINAKGHSLTMPTPLRGRSATIASRKLDTTIDPIVPRLLMMGELRLIIPSSPSSSQPNNNASNDTKKRSYIGVPPTEHRWGVELERMKQVKQLLILLRGALENNIIETAANVNERDDDEHERTNNYEENSQNDIHGTKVRHQLNGVAVPLLGILQQQPPPLSSNNQNLNERMHFIVRSAHYACMEEAALALASLWRLQNRLFNGNAMDKGGTDGTGRIATSTTEFSDSIHSLVLPSLISCAIALSSLEITKEKREKTNVEGEEERGSTLISNDEKKISEGMSMDDQALDRGEDCAAAVLLCMRSFFCDANRDCNTGDDNRCTISKQIQECGNANDGSVSVLSRGIAAAMGGGLVARLVEGCLSLLQQESSNDLTYSNNSRKVSRRENDVTLQIDALKTLQAIMTGVPVMELWASILPGCFAGLYRTALSKLRYSSCASSYKVASSCVHVLTILLKQSLSRKPLNTCADPTGSMDGNDKMQSITASLMAAVQQSNQQYKTVDTSDTESLRPPENQMQELRIEVNERLRGPLSVLLSILPTNRSAAVRKSGLYLCRIILMDIRSVWTAPNIKDLARKALEYCLMMLGDEDDEIARCSRSTLQSYKAHLGATNHWKRQLSRSAVPTILELVEALPALAKSGRESQVRHHLRLVDGYIVLSFRGMTNDFDLHECLSTGKRKSDIGSALSCTEVVDVVKDAFSVIFAPDIDSITCGPMIETGSSSDEIALYGESNGCRFLYLRDEQVIEAAKNTVRLFARALGTKRCAFVIDACFAVMFEACSRCDGQHLLTNEELLNRRRCWAGVCVFATELMRGICGFGDDGGRKESFKLSKSNLHVLSSLASSILPVVVSGPVWMLPTTLDVPTEESISDAQVLPSNEVNAPNLPITIMNSNAILISTLMGFLCQLARALGDSVKLQLPTILFPLLERASPIGNHSYVQRAAFACLWKISRSVGYRNISCLLASNFDYLVDILSLRLCKYAREQSALERSLFGAVDVILQSAISRVRPASSDVENGDEPLFMGHVAMVEHMLNCLLGHFDRQSYNMDNLSLFDTVSVFRSMNTFMDASIDVFISNNKDGAAPIIPEEDNDDGCFLRRLDFELSIESTGCSEDIDSNDDIFGQQAPYEEGDPTEQAPPFPNSDHSSNNDEADETSDFVQEICAINGILSRCCYLLCNADLRIQVLCCETILSGFRSLGKVGSFRKNLHGKFGSINPLLPAIAEFWPSIAARLRSASASLTSANRLSRSDLLSIRHVMATDQPEHGAPSKSSLEVLISKLLLILSVLCSSEDGFFADRFENDAYPIVAGLMQDILPEDGNGSGGRHFPGQQPPSSLFAKSKHSLVLPIVHCLTCTFESSCRYGLTNLILSAGTMLFPLLSDTGPIGDAALVALKAMLLVDRDALWRGLLTLSGRAFPCHPMIRSSVITITNKAVPAFNDVKDLCVASSQRLKYHDRTISLRAGDLLDFIERLPEQPIP